jgi:Uma2 family endonuclease
MNIATADTVIPIPFMADTRSVRLHFDFEDQKRKMTPDEFWAFCIANKKLRAELTKDGDVIIMAPTGFKSSDSNSEVIFQLKAWAKKNGTGRVTESNGAYVLPSGATYAPDAAWVRNERLKHFTPEQMKKFLPLAPDLVIELRSESDSLNDSKARMAEWIENGVQLGWFIDPQNKQVHIYRYDRDVEILDDPAKVSGEDILPGFSLNLTEVW